MTSGYIQILKKRCPSFDIVKKIKCNILTWIILYIKITTLSFTISVTFDLILWFCWALTIVRPPNGVTVEIHLYLTIIVNYFRTSNMSSFCILCVWSINKASEKLSEDFFRGLNKTEAEFNQNSEIKFEIRNSWG